MTASDLGLATSITASCAFFVLAVAVAVTRRSPAPISLPATSDVGPETPAVANLLANGGRLTPDAVPATLLDLAARHVVAIEETQPGSYACRLKAGSNTGLNAYESRVLDLLLRQAEGSLVPAQALTTGPTEQAAAWLKRFTNEVVADARRAGLCARRWPAAVTTVLALLALAAVLLATYSGNSERATSLQMVAIGLAVVTLFLLVKVFGEDAQIVTAAGLPAQARWLALRRYLHEDEVFGGLPPTAVAVRDRYLAYGAALGVAAGAVRPIPMGAESDRWAWTSYGGQWRQVSVSYPTRWPPAWGAGPGEAAWSAIRLGGIGLFILWVASKVLPALAGGNPDLLNRSLALAVLAVSGVALLMVGAGLYLLLLAVLSLLAFREVTGEAVRLRRYGEASACYAAVYTGAGDHVRAWVVRPELYAAIREYQVVTASVSPLSGYVRTLKPAAVPVASLRPTA